MKPMEKNTPKQYPITWKSFGISCVIILVVYLAVSLLLEKPSDKTTKQENARQVVGSHKYEYEVIDGDDNSSDSILSIPINGIILTDSSADSGFFDFLQEGGATYGYDVKDELKRAANDPSIKAIMLEINSPGGTVSGANAIAEGVAYYKKVTGHPVYSHITDLGASGAYWSAASTDYIVSEIGSTVGSIGVIMGPFKYYNKVTAESSFGGGVQTDGGIDYTYITAGQYKDTGSPYRKMTDDEVKHWQTAINNEYDGFVTYVSSRRNISRDTIVNQIKALPYDTKRALELHLIDKVGSKEFAQDLLAQKAGITDYNVVQENQALNFIQNIFKKVETLQPKQAANCRWCNQPLLLYDGSYSWLK
jgi:protease-4